ncbi:MAG: RnfABCDGE type electron transport complex subunit B [Gammaproteobacteria bacterium]
MVEHDLVERIEQVLPQTQCQRCGFAACTPYAHALAAGAAAIDLCPPGGESTRQALAALLGKPTRAASSPAADECPEIAIIVEADCIGCTKCVQSCPVDAIVGAAGLLHGIVADWCTGCGLCLPVCPTDCIAMYPHPAPPADASARRDRALQARQRYESRQQRLAASPRDPLQAPVYVEAENLSAAELEDAVRAAVQRRRARQHSRYAAASRPGDGDD